MIESTAFHNNEEVKMGTLNGRNEKFYDNEKNSGEKMRISIIGSVTMGGFYMGISRQGSMIQVVECCVMAGVRILSTRNK